MQGKGFNGQRSVKRNESPDPSREGIFFLIPMSHQKGASWLQNGLQPLTGYLLVPCLGSLRRLHSPLKAAVSSSAGIKGCSRLVCTHEELSLKLQEESGMIEGAGELHTQHWLPRNGESDGYLIHPVFPRFIPLHVTNICLLLFIPSPQVS